MWKNAAMSLHKKYMFQEGKASKMNDKSVLLSSVCGFLPEDV